MNTFKSNTSDRSGSRQQPKQHQITQPPMVQEEKDEEQVTPMGGVPEIDRRFSTPQKPTSQTMDYNHYRQLFSSENVKSLLKELKTTMKTVKKSSEVKNPTLSSLDFKLAFIRKQALKAELDITRKKKHQQQRQQKRQKSQSGAAKEEQPGAVQ